MIGLLISVDDNQVHEIEIDEHNFLRDVRSAIGCDYIDLVRDVNIGGRRYDILVDDEGMLKGPEPQPTARCMDYDQFLFGSIIILKGNNETGEHETLSHVDIASIQQHIFGIRNKETYQISPMLEYTYSDSEEFIM